MHRRALLTAAVAACTLSIAAVPAGAAEPSPFFNGFETDTAGWFTPTRVASGTGGVTSATGAFHAEVAEDAGDFTRWGGYTDEFPAAGYTTSVAVYLDPAAIPANDTRFDWTSAVSTPQGDHRRDFVFNAGGYTDGDPDFSSATDYFVISASPNAGRADANPKNPARDPFVIDEAGWYTLQHTFRDDGTGVLAVDLGILDAAGTELHSWTLSDAGDVIDDTVGGNRYGWFATQEFSALAIDDSELFVAVGPPTSKDDCKKGGWQEFNTPRTFKNQGDCVSHVAAGRGG